jgi:acetyltransferase
MPQSQLVRYTQIDYDREMAFIATTEGGAGEAQTLGVVRAVADADNTQAEFAIVVRPDLQRQGLGLILMEKIIRYCRAKGCGELYGETLADNTAMLRLAKACGFTRCLVFPERVVQMRLALRSAQA